MQLPGSRWFESTSRAGALRRCVQFGTIISLAVSVVAAGAACGEEEESVAGILTMVRVEERLEDGTWVPTDGAQVQYQIWAGTTHNAQVSLYHEYQDVTDGQGLSAVNRDPGEKVPGGIGMIFVDVTHPDGRTSFRRAPAEEFFDFEAWSRKFPSGPAELDEIVDQVCTTALDFPDCAKRFEREGFKGWGVGFLVRFR